MRVLEEDEDAVIRSAIDHLHQALALLQDELGYGGHAPTSLRRAATQHTRRAWLLLTGSQNHHIADGPPAK